MFYVGWKQIKRQILIKATIHLIVSKEFSCISLLIAIRFRFEYHSLFLIWKFLQGIRAHRNSLHRKYSALKMR